MWVERETVDFNGCCQHAATIPPADDKSLTKGHCALDLYLLCSQSKTPMPQPRVRRRATAPPFA